MPDLHLTLDEQPDQAVLQRIIDGVRAYNFAVTGHQKPQPYGVFLLDEAGTIVGGVQASLWGNAVHIDALWVEEAYRGRGHGEALMHATEAHAMAQGKKLAYVETMSFQARPFYEKLGYEVFGQIEELADGHTFYILKKAL